MIMTKKTANRNNLLFVIACGLIVTLLSTISDTNNNIPGGGFETVKPYVNSKANSHQSVSTPLPSAIPQNPSHTSPSNAAYIQTLDVRTIRI